MKQILLLLIRAYRKAVSPFLGSHCRFYPSCSEYAETAVTKKGTLRGLAMAAVRILKCNPIHPGGFDCVE